MEILGRPESYAHFSRVQSAPAVARSGLHPKRAPSLVGLEERVIKKKWTDHIHFWPTIENVRDRLSGKLRRIRCIPRTLHTPSSTCSGSCREISIP